MKKVRAERLLALVRLLSDGRARTIPALAEALEVSPRTLVRDLDALRAAGMPVVARRGREGGISMPREWSRPGQGLRAEEVGPLAALVAPADGAVGPALATALARVRASLPASLRTVAEDARQRLLVDPTPWWSAPRTEPWLDALRDAVWEQRRVRLGYRDGAGRRSERVVEPLALALKGERWHLVTGAPLRVFRCDRITAVEVLDELFARPADFDLPATWADWCARFEAERPRYPVRLRLEPAAREALRALRPREEHAALEAEEPVIDFQRRELALACLAQVGPGARALDPPELVEALRALARAWG